MDVVDRNLERAQQEATRTYSQISRERRISQDGSRHSRLSAISSSDSSSSSPSSGMGRIATASGASVGFGSGTTRTRTHPIEMHRTATHRLQHAQTVGTSIKSKTATQTWPEFGAGKPYPAQLPEQEEYVVEFAGKDDPLHPQNWPLNRKFVNSVH